MPVPPISERDFQRQVTDLAAIYHWDWLHFRAAQTSHGWRTPVSGTLANGWPDLVLCRPPRLLLAELKAEKGRVSEHQERWLDMLRACPGVETFVWRPSQIDEIAEVLR